jgi:hypothetical protein
MRVEEFKKYKEEESQTHLWFRDEVVGPRDVINDNHNLSLDGDVALQWTTKKREAITHLDGSLILLGE